MILVRAVGHDGGVGRQTLGVRLDRGQLGRPVGEEAHERLGVDRGATLSCSGIDMPTVVPVTGSASSGAGFDTVTTAVSASAHAQTSQSCARTVTSPESPQVLSSVVTWSPTTELLRGFCSELSTVTLSPSAAEVVTTSTTPGPVTVAESMTGVSGRLARAEENWANPWVKPPCAWKVMALVVLVTASTSWVPVNDGRAEAAAYQLAGDERRRE